MRGNPGKRRSHRIVWRPCRVGLALHEGERFALMQLAELDMRTPNDMIRMWLYDAAAMRGVKIEPPPSEPRQVGEEPSRSRRGYQWKKPKPQPTAGVDEVDFEVDGDKVKAKLKR